MSRRFSFLVGLLRSGRWFRVAGLFGCLALCGCCNPDLRGDRFTEDPDAGLLRQMRPAGHLTEQWGISNKSVQIEQNLGVP